MITLVLVAFAIMVAGQVPGVGVAEQIAVGDAAYQRFDNDEALAHYVKALDAAPSSHEALWKAARSYADVGAGFEEVDPAKAKALYERGVAAARKAVAVNAESADAHFILAACIGRLALFEGGRTKIELSREVRQEAERAIEVDPKHDGAYYVLGRWHYSVATLSWILKALAKVIYGGVPPGATVEKAAELFATAIEIDGTRPGHHLEYARALVKLERYSEARRHLETCIMLPQVYWEDPSYKAEAAKMLDNIRGKKQRT